MDNKGQCGIKLQWNLSGMFGDLGKVWVVELTENVGGFGGDLVGVRASSQRTGSMSLVTGRDMLLSGYCLLAKGFSTLRKWERIGTPGSLKAERSELTR